MGVLMQLQSSACGCADTELEAEVEPSLETEQRLAAEAAAAEQVCAALTCTLLPLGSKCLILCTLDYVTHCVS